MALFDVFKKKKNDFMELPMGQPAGYGPAGFPPQQGPGAGFPPADMPGAPPMDMQQFQQPVPMGPSPEIENLRRNMETLNYKLDSIKAALDAINNRLANIETALRTTPGFETKSEGGWT